MSFQETGPLPNFPEQNPPETRHVPSEIDDLRSGQPLTLPRSHSTPASARIPMALQPSQAHSCGKTQRTKLNYPRASVACAQCRARKIRCQTCMKDSKGRCDSCARLGKDCSFVSAGPDRANDLRSSESGSNGDHLEDGNSSLADMGGAYIQHGPVYNPAANGVGAIWSQSDDSPSPVAVSSSQSDVHAMPPIVTGNPAPQPFMPSYMDWHAGNAPGEYEQASSVNSMYGHTMQGPYSPAWDSSMLGRSISFGGDAPFDHGQSSLHHIDSSHQPIPYRVVSHHDLPPSMPINDPYPPVVPSQAPYLAQGYAAGDMHRHPQPQHGSPASVDSRYRSRLNS